MEFKCNHKQIFYQFCAIHFRKCRSDAARWFSFCRFYCHMMKYDRQYSADNNSTKGIQLQRFEWHKIPTVTMAQRKGIFHFYCCLFPCSCITFPPLLPLFLSLSLALFLPFALYMCLNELLAFLRQSQFMVYCVRATATQEENKKSHKIYENQINRLNIFYL